MKTLADLKRKCAVGTKLKLVATNIDGHKSLGITRTVFINNSRGLQLDMPPYGSELHWPKAEQLTFHSDDSFTITHGRVYLRYEFVA